MNILINFRYLSMIDSSIGSISDATESKEINSLTKEFKRIAQEYKALQVSTNDFLVNNKIYLDAKSIIKETALKWIDIFNKNEDYYCYMWVDEICSIIVDGPKAIPLENSEEYVNFEDLKHTIQKCMYELTRRDNTIIPETYSNVFFVVYLDIIEKGLPTFFINSAWYNK